MALLKKTVVLANQKTVGFLTFVRVASAASAKIVLSEPMAYPLWVGLRVGETPPVFARLVGEKTEVSVPLFETRDTIAACLVDQNGGFIANGGAIDNKLQAATSHKASGNLGAEPTKEPAPQARGADGDRSATSPLFARKKEPNFFASVAEKVEELFTIHAREPELERRIPDSEWVRVYYDKDEFYVVGKLKEGGVVTHLVYGIPGKAHVAPPKEAAEVVQFFRASGAQPNEGYWLLMQSAKDGTMLRNQDET